MRNLKKIIAVVVTLVMLLGIAAVSASAAETQPTLALYGKELTGLTGTDANSGDSKEYYELAVHLTDAGNTVGGIEGVITYNTAVFTYHDVILNDTFVAAGNPDAASVVSDDGNGNIKFVGLNNASSVGEWFVLRFEVTAAGTGDFAFSAVKGANTSGYVTVTASPDSATASESELLKVEGATIKRNSSEAAQDIKFRVVVDATQIPSGATVQEYGLLLMFTKRLGYRELEYEMIDNGETGLAWAKVDPAAVTDGAYEVNLNNMKASQLGVKVSARAFALLSNGDIVYSQNYNSEYSTNAGYDSKSVVDVARLAARYIIDNGHCDDSNTDVITAAQCETILALDAIRDTNRTNLLAFVTAYYPNPNAAE